MLRMFGQDHRKLPHSCCSCTMYSGRRTVSRKGHSQRLRKASIVYSMTLLSATTSVLSLLEGLAGITPPSTRIGMRIGCGIHAVLRSLAFRIKNRDAAKGRCTFWTSNPLSRASLGTGTPSGTSTPQPRNSGYKSTRKRKTQSMIHCKRFPLWY